MAELRLGDQTVRFDRAATAAIYASLKGGWAEDCGCRGCRNLMAQRGDVYPGAFRELLAQLGVDINKESEAVLDGPLPDGGLQHYGGWFFFAGEMVAAGQGLTVVSESPNFAYFFTPVGPQPKAFNGVPSIAVEFVAHFPWVLTGEEP